MLGFRDFSEWDWAAIATYFFFIIAVLCYVSWTNSKGAKEFDSYFLSGRNEPFWIMGFSLFASNLGTDHLVGLAGSGAAQGIAVGSYEWSGAIGLTILGYFFMPVYLAYDISTTPEWLEKRYDRSLRTFYCWFSLATIMLTKISVTVFAGAVVIERLVNVNFYAASCVLLLCTALYTMAGGLKAVLYTETFMAVLLIVGCSFLLYYADKAVGGWSGLTGKVPDDHMHLMHDFHHPDFPWTGVIFGMTINSIWYWCTDQVMVQRVLATRSAKTAANACNMAAILKILPMFLIVFPGLYAKALYPEQMEKDSNLAFVYLVDKILPPGVRGLVIAVMLSSFMAALSSCFNSASSLYVNDIYLKWYPGSSETRQVDQGRYCTMGMAVASLLWLPVVEMANDELFLYIQGMQVIWCAPVAVVFVAGMYTRVSSGAAKLTLFVNFSIGVVFWIVSVFFHITIMNILHYAIVSLALSIVTMWVGDLCFKTPVADDPIDTYLLPEENISCIRKAELSWWSPVITLGTILVLTIVFR